MANFKIGQRVVCITKEEWTFLGHPSNGPKYKEELTIHSFDIDGSGYLVFEEHCKGDSFEPEAFAPISTMKESQKYAEKLLKEIIIEIEEENSVLK